MQQAKAIAEQFRRGGVNSDSEFAYVASGWAQERNDLPAVAAVMLEVAIQRKQSAARNSLGKPNQTRIGERHGGVHVPLHQRLYAGRVLLEIDPNNEAPLRNLADQIHGFPARPLNQKTCLGEHWFARHERWIESGHLIRRPSMPSIAAIEIGD